MDVTMHIGRVGALAVALGIGTAIAGTSGTALGAPDATPPSQQHTEPKSASAPVDSPTNGKRGHRSSAVVNAPKTRPSQTTPPHRPTSTSTANPPAPSREVHPASAAGTPKTQPLTPTKPKQPAPTPRTAATAPIIAPSDTKSVVVQLDSTTVGTPLAQLPATARMLTVPSPQSNGTKPSTPVESFGWAIAAWVRRNSNQTQATGAQVPNSTSAATPVATTALKSVAASQTSLTSTTAPAAATASTNPLSAFLSAITTIFTPRSSKPLTLAAGTASVGKPNTTTGAVTGSLNFKGTSSTAPTYSVTTQPTYGTVTVNSNGTFTYTPTKLARDISAVSANQTTATFTVLASSGSSTASETVTVPVLATTINGDSTAVLQNVFSNLAPNSTLTMAAKTFYHSGVLRIEAAGITINGNGATLQATNDATSAVEIVADHVSVSNMTFGANQTGPRYGALEQHKLVIGGNYDYVSKVTINGAAGAGVFVNGAGWFTLSGVTVNNSRADGIHMTNGAHDGTVTDAVTNNTGDDGIAIVSYIPDGNICRNITINNPTVNGTIWGRGVSVVGGQNITYNNIKVSKTNAAGIYIAAEPSYNTMGVNGVIVNGGTVTGANYNASVVHGAILVYSGNTGQPVTNVTIENLSVSGTASTAQRQLGLILDSGATASAINFKNLTFAKSSLSTFYTNAPKIDYTSSNILVGGTLIQI